MDDNRGPVFIVWTLIGVGMLFLVVGLLSDEREWATVTGGVVILFALCAWIAISLDRRDKRRAAEGGQAPTEQ